MAITYEIKINGARVQDQDGMVDVVKELDVSVTGKDGASSFVLPFSVKLSPAEEATFTPFGSLTEEEMVAWVEAQADQLASIKAHIAMVVDKEVAKAALTNKPLPWAPVPEPAPVPPTEPPAP